VASSRVGVGFLKAKRTGTPDNDGVIDTVTSNSVSFGMDNGRFTFVENGDGQE